jgi:hypothetical protein
MDELERRSVAQMRHLPVTCQVFVEEYELFGSSGCNLRVDVLADDGEIADIVIDDCGVFGRQGQRRKVRSAALNGGRI